MQRPTVIEATPGLAWVKLASLVLTTGHPVKDGDEDLLEVIGAQVIVEQANQVDSVVALHGDSDMIYWMTHKNFGSPEPVLDWGYSYGMRLRDFNGHDQIKAISDRLRSNPDSKSATLVLMSPADTARGHVPCIVAVDCKVRQGRLDTFSFFRSQDVGKKFYADVLALGELQEVIATDTGIDVGSCTIFIVSAHIYNCDKERIADVVKSANVEKRRPEDLTITVA